MLRFSAKIHWKNTNNENLELKVNNTGNHEIKRKLF